jgi:hypothetical protein
MITFILLLILSVIAPPIGIPVLILWLAWPFIAHVVLLFRFARGIRDNSDHD